MEIVIHTSPFYKINDNKKILKLIKEAGFNCYDISLFNCMWENEYTDLSIINRDNYIEIAKDLKKYADSLGLKCVQAHAPWYHWPTPENRELKVKMVVRSFEVCEILGCNICVVHPYNVLSIEENIAEYAKLLPYAKKHNVKIAVENMFNWEDDHTVECACSTPDSFLDQMKVLDPEWFTACVDIGHACMFKGFQAEDMIKKLGNYVGCLHIHDNDKRHDLHLTPYTQSIYYEPVYKALKEIGYKGNITLEVEHFIEKFPIELYLPAAKLLKEIAQYFKERVE